MYIAVSQSLQYIFSIGPSFPFNQPWIVRGFYQLSMREILWFYSLMFSQLCGIPMVVSGLFIRSVYKWHNQPSCSAVFVRRWVAPFIQSNESLRFLSPVSIASRILFVHHCEGYCRQFYGIVIHNHHHHHHNSIPLCMSSHPENKL